ncbi:MAG: hypothetical protein GF400_11705, partial [Candidatus Eisenbacteria bacterium]|nr:hypothetical protein [Candidatus Eisenbacteria bacterium]
MLRRERGRGTFVTDGVLKLGEVGRGELAATVGVVTFEDPALATTREREAGSRAWHDPFRVL